MRDRRLKAEFWSDEKVSRLPSGARLLFLALLNWVDDKGRGRGSAALVRSFAFTYDDSVTSTKVEEWLGALETSGRIVRYDVRCEQYLCVPRLCRHQYINNASPSRMPPPPREKLESLDLGVPGEDGSKESAILELLDDKPWKGRQEDKKPSDNEDKRKASRDRESQAEAVFAEWCRVMRKTKKAIFSPERKRAVFSCLDQGYSVDDLKEAVYGCRVHPHNNGDNDRGTVYDDLSLICRNASNVERFRETYACWRRKRRISEGVDVDTNALVEKPADSTDLFDRVNREG